MLGEGRIQKRQVRPQTVEELGKLVGANLVGLLFQPAVEVAHQHGRCGGKACTDIGVSLADQRRAAERVVPVQ